MGRSPVKVAVAIIAFGFLVGLGVLLWSEGLPGQKVTAETSDKTQVRASVVKYAEAVVAAKNSAEAAAAFTGDSRDIAEDLINN